MRTSTYDNAACQQLSTKRPNTQLATTNTTTTETDKMQCAQLSMLEHNECKHEMRCCCCMNQAWNETCNNIAE